MTAAVPPGASPGVYAQLQNSVNLNLPNIMPNVFTAPNGNLSSTPTNNGQGGTSFYSTSQEARVASANSVIASQSSTPDLVSQAKRFLSQGPAPTVTPSVSAAPQSNGATSTSNVQTPNVSQQVVGPAAQKKVVSGTPPATLLLTSIGATGTDLMGS